MHSFLTINIYINVILSFEGQFVSAFEEIRAYFTFSQHGFCIVKWFPKTGVGRGL